MMDTQISVLLIDDHQMFRDGVRRYLEQQPDVVVAGEASGSAEALALQLSPAPDVAIVDIRLGADSGFDLVKPLRERWPGIRVVIVTGYDFDQYVRAAARANVDGYILKDGPLEGLLGAIRQVAAGGVAMPPRIASKVKSFSRRSNAEGSQLTARELEILDRMHQGLRNQEIGEQFGISVRTVEAHAASILAKLGARSRTEAVNIAVRQRLIR